MTASLISDIEFFGALRTDLRLSLENADWPTTLAATKAGIFSAQSFGFRAERFAADAFGWDRVPVSQQRGDLVTSDDEYVELKTSIAANDQVMIRQIRQSHRVNWLVVLVAADDGMTEIYALDRQDVEHESRDMVAAHGTRATASELAMSFPRGGAIHERWQDNYLVSTVHHLTEATAAINETVTPWKE